MKITKGCGQQKGVDQEFNIFFVRVLRERSILLLLQKVFLQPKFIESPLDFMRLNGLFTAYQPFPSKTHGLTGGLMGIHNHNHHIKEQNTHSYKLDHWLDGFLSFLKIWSITSSTHLHYGSPLYTNDRRVFYIYNLFLQSTTSWYYDNFSIVFFIFYYVSQKC